MKQFIKLNSTDLAKRRRLLLGHLVLSALRLEFVLMLRTFIPKLVMCTDLSSFEHPISILLLREKSFKKTMSKKLF